MDFLVHFMSVLQPGVLLLLLIGLVVGVMIGATPGLSSTFAVAVMLPLTLAMDPLPALVFLGSVLMGSTYGGAFAAILLNTPGTPQNITTTFDGFPMTKRGDGDLALTITCIVSAIGGFVGVLAFLSLAPPLALVALRFGPPEMFWLALFGLTIIASLSEGNLIKGLISGCIGLAISIIGVAVVSADTRFTFGYSQLSGGIHIIPATVGLLCLPVLFDMMGSKEHHLNGSDNGICMRFRESCRVIKGQLTNLGRSSALGTLIGILPGAGGAIASLIAYSAAKRNSGTDTDEPAYGEGNAGGVIASESANNATVGGGLVPTFVLGIPGSPPDAVILAALLIHGLQIGPSLFADHATLVFSFTSGMMLASLLLIPVGLLMGRMIYRFVLQIPKTFLVPLIAFVTILGGYAIRNNYYDVVIMIILGAMGWLLSRLGFPTAPIVLGILLGPIAETGFSQTFMVGSARGDLTGAFFGSSISMVLVALIVLALFAPLLKKLLSVEGIFRSPGAFFRGQ